MEGCIRKSQLISGAALQSMHIKFNYMGPVLLLKWLNLDECYAMYFLPWPIFMIRLKSCISYALLCTAISYNRCIKHVLKLYSQYTVSTHTNHKMKYPKYILVNICMYFHQYTVYLT